MCLGWAEHVEEGGAGATEVMAVSNQQGCLCQRRHGEEDARAGGGSRPDGIKHGDGRKGRHVECKVVGHGRAKRGADVMEERASSGEGEVEAAPEGE